MTYRATKLDPPRINESPEQLFKWRQRVFELLNGITEILADGVEISPTPIGQLTADNVQDLVVQLDAIINALQDNLATTVVAEDTFGLADAVGASTVFAREDHTHGSPTDPVPAHVAAADPHAQYATDMEFTDHSARHENGGADEISIAGLSGEAADNQPSKTHGNERHDPSSVFPVGSLYANTTGDDPSILLGYGTWYLATTL